jgi:glycosyltransferase involved in cell wall biosynthesis
MAAIINNMRSILVLRQLLRKKRPDVAIGIMTTASVLLALAGQQLPIFRIGSEHIHPPMMPLGAWWGRLRAYIYGKLNAVVALTRESAEWLRVNTNVKRVVVINNSVPWPLPSMPPRRDRGQVFRPGRLILLAVGRLVEQKGFDLLIQAFASIASTEPGWDLVIVGEGPQREDLEIRIRNLGISERVFLPGRVGNVGEWYEAAHLFVMSSRFEGFGNTLAEAMAYGLPVVSFDCLTGPRDIIRHEVDGLLVSPLDVPALAQALVQLMRNGEMRAHMARKAVEARERFAVERIAGMWEDLFIMNKNYSDK